MRRKALLGLAAGMLFAVPFAAWADSISPTSFTATGPTGFSATVRKTVTITTAAPTDVPVDVFFLADTTGSMGGAIAAVRTAAASILASAAGLGDVAFGVGEYKDTFDAYRYRLNTDITTNQASVLAGIDLWVAGGGADGPEANLFALEAAAESTAWRAGSERILVWFGDWPGHDPDPLVGGSTEASATAALLAAGVHVEAVSLVDTGPGLDGGPFPASGEGGPVTPGQATRITAATGGHLYAGIDTGAIVDVINDAITTAISTYTTVGLDLSEVPAGVFASATPGVYVGAFDRTIERTFTFDLTLTDLEPGTHTFNIYATVDGGRVAVETDTIVSVPEPAALLLLGAGLLGLGAYRRKK